MTWTGTWRSWPNGLRPDECRYANPLYDVYLSHGVHDTGIAAVVKRALSNAGLEAYAVADRRPGKPLPKEMRRALAECSAVVLILTRSTLASPYLAFDVGTAMAWSKPVYLLYDRVTRQEIPEHLRKFHVHPITAVERVVEEFAKGRRPLSEPDREALVDVYQKLGVPTDRLLIEPMALDELCRQFREESGTSVSGEKLMRELIRLRKQGRLPKVRKS